MSEPLDPYMAVFNGHINDASKRARALMREVAPRWLAEIEELEKEGDGIMHIFNVDVTPAIYFFGALVCAYVNEDRISLGEDEPPQYCHDCENCVFLGRFKDDEGRYDLYYHDSESERTVLARYGEEGGDYMSGLTFGLREDSQLTPLIEAVRRARARGLDVTPRHG